MSLLDRIRIFLKSKYDLISNEQLKNHLFNALPFWTGAFIAGGLAVLYAKLFSWAENFMRLVFELSNYAFFLITPLCFILATWMVKKWAPNARGSGIPQVSAAIDLTTPNHSYSVKSLLGIRIILVKIISSLVMALGGGIIGREGPTIQISASIFNKINDLLPDWYPPVSRRNMIVTGAAAGLAAAFNTPLGGIVFAIEELTKIHFNYLKSALLTGVIIAGFTALSILGPYLYLGYPDLENLSPWLIVLTIPLAFITGIAGSSMGSAIIYVLKRKKELKTKFQNILYLIVCGILVAAMGIFVNGHLFGSGKELMVETLFSADKQVDWYFPFLKIIGQIISFSTGASGGIFAPSLSVGASIGSVFAGWFKLSPEETNLIILCGMTGFLTSITRSPFTSAILVLEMTNSHNVIFYIMLTALFSNIIAPLVSKHSFYDYLKDVYIREVHIEEPQQKS